MDNQDVIEKIRDATLFLVHAVLQQNGRPDITEDQTYDLVMKTIDSLIEDREGP